MTNTIYFYLDDASYSTSSSSPDSILSRQQSQQGFGPAVVEASSSSVVVAAEAINALIRPPSWVNREQVDKPDQNLSSNSASFTFRSEGEISHFSNLKSFSFKELKTATNNFSPDYLLGQGGFGKVFKGWMEEYKLTATKRGTGTAVAVKRLHQESLQGHEQWLAEINHLGQLDHLNLVKLIGSCLDNQERLLVYEFMPESLDNHLFRRNSYGQLSWSIRMKIALGTAKALAFLHSAEVNVIHRGCKSSNILLDLNYNAKLSDFGVARDGPTGDMSHVYTSVMGTQGYACPEYIGTDDASVSSCSSPDHNLHSSSHQVQSDQNLGTSQLNVDTLSLYSVIGKACFACTRPSPELSNDNNSTISIGNGTVNTEIHVSSDSNRNLSLTSVIRDSPSNFKIFCFKELSKIMSTYFNNDFNVFGRNGYETVFTGWIDENTGTVTQRGRGGIAIAIKRVYQGRAKNIWLVPARLAYLAQLHHPNLVRLVGYCLKEEPRLLVSEYMPFGSLEDHLFKEDSQQLSWSLRMKIALGAAKGLAFLHNAETEVVHGDFKPSNVLLDLNYNARVSDFGLAVDSPRAYYVEAIYGDVEIGLNFLNGYTAPECLDSGDLTPKSDVYSFGVVLLEMLFSRRIVNKYSKPLGTEHIEVKTAKRCLNNKRKLFGALNCSFDGQYAIEIPQKAATLALKCLSMQANSRPTMNEVVRALEMI